MAPGGVTVLERFSPKAHKPHHRHPSHALASCLLPVNAPRCRHHDSRLRRHPQDAMLDLKLGPVGPVMMPLLAPHVACDDWAWGSGNYPRRYSNSRPNPIQRGATRDADSAGVINAITSMLCAGNHRTAYVTWRGCSSRVPCRANSVSLAEQHEKVGSDNGAGNGINIPQ